MRTETLFSGIVLILLCLSLLVYVQSYVTELQANENITSTDKAILRFVPTFMVIFIIVLAGLLVWQASKGVKG